MIFIGKSVVIKGELSCGEDLYIDGQVEGTRTQLLEWCNISVAGVIDDDIEAPANK